MQWIEKNSLIANLKIWSPPSTNNNCFFKCIEKEVTSIKGWKSTKTQCNAIREKFGIEDEVGDDNWDYFDQHVADNLDMYYEELNNLINNSYPDGDSASGVVLLVNGKIVAGKAYKI